MRFNYFFHSSQASRIDYPFQDYILFRQDSSKLVKTMAFIELQLNYFNIDEIFALEVELKLELIISDGRAC